MRRLQIMLLLGLLLACTEDSGFDGIYNTGKQGSITRFAISGNYMYSLDLNQILVFSIAANGETDLVNKVSTDYGLETIIIYDKTIYVGSTTSLYILDITIPESPKVLSQLNRGEALIGGCDPVVVKDNYAYSTVKIIENRCGQVRTTSQLLTYDVSNKYSPFEVSTFPMDEPNGLGYEGNYLFVCDQGVDMIKIFDISVPTNPAYVEFVDLIDPIDLIPVDGKMIVSTTTDFVVYDISDVNNITKLSTIPKK